MQLQRFITICAAITIHITLIAQKDPATTEVWKPEVKVVTPGKTNTDAPSDAIVLFDGKSGTNWQQKKGGDLQWTLADGSMTVKPGTGDIQKCEGYRTGSW
jgi:hypothetical protein